MVSIKGSAFLTHQTTDYDFGHFARNACWLPQYLFFIVISTYLCILEEKWLLSEFELDHLLVLLIKAIIGIPAHFAQHF